MKKEFTHYGQKVLLAGNRSRYEMILEKNNVEYIPLPILSKTCLLYTSPLHVSF